VEVAFTHSSAVHTKYLGSGLDVPPAVVVIYRDHSGKEESAVLTAQQLSHVINQPPHEAAGFLPYSEIYRFIVTTATPTVGYVPAELHNITSAESKATGEQVWPAQSNQGVVALYAVRCPSSSSSPSSHALWPSGMPSVTCSVTPVVNVHRRQSCASARRATRTC
jgi:hypothetical protein